MSRLFRRFSARRISLIVALAALLGGLVGATINGTRMLLLKADNADIRALASGRDIPVDLDARPKLLHARALFLLKHAQIEEGAAAGTALARAGSPGLRSEIQFTLGNARMRRAFELIETNQIDAALPEVNLAKAAYRAALALRPGYFDAKVNLEIAMRLVRDLPQQGQTGQPEDETRPRKVWTDLPGMPRGYP